MDGVMLYTRNIYLLGSAEKGPVNYPVHITSIDTAKRIFGTNGSLIDGASQVVDMQVPCNLWLVKTTGRHSEVKLNVLLENGDIIKGGLIFRSRHADDICNNIEVFLDDRYLSFKLTGYKCEEVVYDLSKYTLLKELVDDINNDTRKLNNEIVCILNCPYETVLEFALTPVNDSYFKMSGGKSGLFCNKNEMFFSLQNTYATLEGQFTDIVVPLNAYYDDTYTEDSNYVHILECNKDYLKVKNKLTETYESFYKQLITFCVQQMQHGFITHGILDTTPRARYKRKIENLPQSLSALKNINELDKDLEKYNMMVSVCFSDVWDNYGTHITSGAVPYATILASTDVTESTTNKRMSNKFLVVDKYSNDILNTISTNGFVCFRYSPLHHLTTVHSGVTLCNNSNFRYIANIRTFQVVAKHFRTFLYKYIGSNIEDLVHSGVLEEQIMFMLQELIQLGLIHSVKTVLVNITEYNHIVIDLDIVSIHTLEAIRISNGICINNGGI